MNRQTQFRGKAIYGELTGKWVYGDLVHDCNDKTFINIEGYSSQGTEVHYRHLVDPETIGQFTGLLDKNGTKIYEGDIIQVGHDNDRYKCRDCVSFIGDIKWNDVSICWDVGGQILTTLSAADAFYNIEVIGNIHDNPEFLKKE